MENNNIQLIELKKNQTSFPRVKITSPSMASDFIRKFYSDDIEIYESSFILLLNRNNETIAYAKISQGGTSGTIVDVKIVCKYAIDSLCSCLILAHNHPSGNLKPSQADLVMTQNLKKALLLFEIPLHDHIILTKDGYYSMNNNGNL